VTPLHSHFVNTARAACCLPLTDFRNRSQDGVADTDLRMQRTHHRVWWVASRVASLRNLGGRCEFLAGTMIRLRFHG
jgi:SnoaL-like domain